MSLGDRFLHDFIGLKRNGLIVGHARVIEIGAQQLSNAFLRSNDQLSEVYRLFNRPQVFLGAPKGEGLAAGLEELPDSAPGSAVPWRSGRSRNGSPVKLGSRGAGR